MSIDASIPLGYKSPDMAQSIAGLLEIRQRQQQLKQQQAQAYQAQQDMQERQAATDILKNPEKFGVLDENGVLDPAKTIPAILKVAPKTGQSFIDPVMNGFKAQLEVSRHAQELNEQQRSDAYGALTGAVSKPNATYGDIVDAADLFKEQNPKASKFVDAALRHLNPKEPMDATRAKITAFGRTLIPPGAQAGPGGLLTQRPTLLDNGLQMQGGTQDPLTGALAASGLSITKVPGPEARMPHIMNNAAGQSVAVNPMDPNQMTPVGGGSPLNPTTAQASTANAAAAGVSTRVQQAQAAANQTTQAQDALSRARTILDDPRIDTGNGFALFKDVKNTMAALGIDTERATDANSLVKNLARYEATRAVQAGLGGTDAARELAHNGSPNTALDKGALKGIITQSLATEKALATYASIQSKIKDPDALIRNESDFRGIPNLIQGYEYGLMRNAKEADAYLKDHGISREQMKETRAKIKEFESR